MALKMPSQKVAEIAIGSIGCGYDIVMGLHLKNCKGNNSKDSCLIELDEDGDHVFVLPDGISIPNVSNSIKCVKGERKRFSSDVLSFQEMSEQFNREISLAGALPSGLFNSMFEFSGCCKKMLLIPRHLLLMGCLTPSTQLKWSNIKCVYEITSRKQSRLHGNLQHWLGLLALMAPI